MIVFLIKLMDHFPKENLEFINKKLHKLEVAIMQLCPCTHHLKFREITQYNNNSILALANMLKANRRMKDTPIRIRLGGPQKQFLLPQLWDCETSGKNIGMYITNKIKEATNGSLVLNMLQGKSESQVEIAKLYWAVNEYSEAMARKGNCQLGQVWMNSASYRTFVHTYRSRPRGPIYGVQMSPVIHPSRVMPVPSIPTMTNLPAYAAVTPPVITPSKRPKFLPPSETPPVEQNFTQPLEYRLVSMNPTSVTFQSNSNMAQNQIKGPVGNVTSAKRKIEEQVKSPTGSSHQQPMLRPKITQQPLRMERPKEPQMKDQKYFPPRPQKVIRTPIHILKREVFSPPSRAVREKESASKNPMKELAKLQDAQRKSPPTPANSTVASNVQEKPLGEVRPMLGSETTQKEIPVVQEHEDKSDEAVSSDNLNLEEMMGGIQESTASSTESTKSG